MGDPAHVNSIAMARRNRRDCRVGLRKKAEKNARRDEQIREIQKVRKGKDAVKHGIGQTGLVAAEARSSTDISSVTSPALDFLQLMRLQAQAESVDVRTRLQACTSDAVLRTSGLGRRSEEACSK